MPSESQQSDPRQRLLAFFDMMGMNEDQRRMFLYELAKRGIGLREPSPNFSPEPGFSEPDAPQLAIPRSPGQSLQDLTDEIVKYWRRTPPAETLAPILPGERGNLLEVPPPPPGDRLRQRWM